MSGSFRDALWDAGSLRVPGAPSPSSRPLDPKRAAILVVDIQPCWYSESALVPAAFPDLPDRVAALLARARAGGMPVVHVRSAYDDSPHVPLLLSLAGPGLNRTLYPPPHAEPWAAEQPGEPVVYKSVFDGFQNTTLQKELAQLNVQRVYLCGLVTSACVLNTALGAFNRGIEPVVVDDCTADRTRARHRATLALFDGYCLRVCRESEVPMAAPAPMAEPSTVTGAEVDLSDTDVALSEALETDTGSSAEGEFASPSPSPSPSLLPPPAPKLSSSPPAVRPPPFKLDFEHISPCTTMDDLGAMTSEKLRLGVMTAPPPAP